MVFRHRLKGRKSIPPGNTRLMQSRKLFIYLKSVAESGGIDT